MKVVKIIIVTMALLAFSACGKKTISPDMPYIIEGELIGLKDGLIINLFQIDGRVGSILAVDTVVGGKFRFEQTMQEPELNKVSLMVDADGFPSMMCMIYVAPGAYIKVSGKNTHLYTWDVKSDVPEQQAYNELLRVAASEYDDYQNLAIEYSRVIQDMMGIDKEAEFERYATVHARYQALQSQQDSMEAIIQRKQITQMEKMAPSQPWMEQLDMMAQMSNAIPGYAFTDEVKALYGSLPENIKQTQAAKEIYAKLYPSQPAKEGDDFPDADLYDLEGNLHHIAEYRGKYILLDFWSGGCGPCITAFPEMKQIYEKYNDKLAIVSISTDPDSHWRKASEVHDIIWSNWNEGKGTGGLYTNYRIQGVPYYVLINPEGKIEKKVMGYGTGSLSQLFAELFEGKK